MNKLILLALVSGFSLSLMAQDDDMYFVPTKENKAKEAKKYGMPQNTYYSGSNRSVDDYNRRAMIGAPIDTTANDIIDFSAVRGVYPDSVSVGATEDDYKLTRQMSRFDDYTPSEAYWDGYRAGRWSSPWYNSWYSWYDYDPWYWDSWYWRDPFYYSSWYGWRYPWYYSTWYSPRYYGYYGYYYPWHGGGYISRGTGSHMSSNLRSYQRRNYNTDGSRRNGTGSRAGNVGVGTRQRSYSSSSSSNVGSRSSGSFGSSSGSFGSSSGGGSRSSGSFGGSSGGGSRSSGGGGGVRSSGGRR